MEGHGDNSCKPQPSSRGYENRTTSSLHCEDAGDTACHGAPRPLAKCHAEGAIGQPPPRAGCCVAHSAVCPYLQPLLATALLLFSWPSITLVDCCVVRSRHANCWAVRRGCRPPPPASDGVGQSAATRGPPIPVQGQPIHNQAVRAPPLHHITV